MDFDLKEIGKSKPMSESTTPTKQKLQVFNWYYT